MSSKFGKFLKTPFGKLASALSVLALIWIVLLWRFLGGGPGTYLPSADEIARLDKELKTARTQEDAQKELVRAAQERKDEYARRLSDYWQDDRDGDVETAWREKIQTIATDHALKLTSLGSVRKSRINQELSWAEIEVAMSGSMAEIAAFMCNLEKMNPRAAWKRFDLRPVMARPPRPGQTPDTSAVQTTEQQLQMSAQLRIMCCETKDGDK